MKIVNLTFLLPIIIPSLICSEIYGVEIRENDRTIVVHSQDIKDGQQDETSKTFDFNFRYSYSSLKDSYYQNGQFESADQNGFKTAISDFIDKSIMARLTVDETRGLGRDPELWPNKAGTPVTFIWHFDFSETQRTIESLIVRASRWHQVGDMRSTVEISTDGVEYKKCSDDTPTEWSFLKDYTDASEYVQGSSEYYLKITIYPWHHNDIRLFVAGESFDESSQNAGFDNLVTLSKPSK